MRSAEEMDQADVELRETILKIWPYSVKNKIELLVPTTKGISRTRLGLIIFTVCILAIAMFVERRLAIPGVSKKMTSFRGQAGWTKWRHLGASKQCWRATRPK